MKGKMIVSVEIKDEYPLRPFPITDKWTFETDNTFEHVDDWLDLFEKILAAQGFGEKHIEVCDDCEFKEEYEKENELRNDCV